MSTQEKILERTKTRTEESKENELIVFNDDVNTFDYVIQLLIDVCGHDPLQAEQCTLLIHYKGKCTVKTGTYEELEPRCTTLLEAGLSAEIN
ncbi:MAG TPA: ATP-dependent Clp protease adaptor ClpS [Flavobacteriaceae bacterium]|nr:ATP-dependent Clp protease adaptor ClpS [Flavobacteriaceae bacterium]